GFDFTNEENLPNGVDDFWQLVYWGGSGVEGKYGNFDVAIYDPAKQEWIHGTNAGDPCVRSSEAAMEKQFQNTRQRRRKGDNEYWFNMRVWCIVCETAYIDKKPI